MATGTGFLWPEGRSPTSLGKAWNPAPVGSIFSLRKFPITPTTVFRLPTECVGTVSADETEKLGLAVGDWISRDSMGITSINGEPIGFWDRFRGRSAPQAWETRPNRRRTLLNLWGNPLANLLGAVLPIPVGSAVLVEGERASRKSDLLWSLLEALSQTGMRVMYVLLERTGEVPLLEAKESRIPVIPEGVELWALTTRQREAQEDLVLFVDFAYAVAKARAGNDEHVALIIDSLKVLADALTRVTPSDGRTLSGGLSGPALDRLAAKYLAVAGHPPDAGSLTVIGSFMLNRQDRGTSSLAETAEGTVDAHIVSLPPSEAKAASFPVDLGASTSRRLEWILEEKAAKAVWQFQAGMSARWTAHLGKLLQQEVEKTSKPVVNPARREELTQEARRLADADWAKLLKAAEVMPAGELWAKWRQIISARAKEKVSASPAVEARAEEIPPQPAPELPELPPAFPSQDGKLREAAEQWFGQLT